MKKIKLVAVDMDGTLLNSEKHCSKRTIEALKKAQDQGVIILPATGRAINGLPQELKDLGVRYGIFCNGATCYDRQEEKVLVANHFSVDEVITLLQLCEKYDATHDIYAGGKGYCEKRYLDHIEEYVTEKPIQKLVKNTREAIDGSLTDFIIQNNISVEKINMFFKDLEEREVARKELAQTGMAEPVSSLTNNLETGRAGCSKGVALEQLIPVLGLTREEVMACGDANNDLTMLKAAGFAVAMGNATEQVKESADYITDTNDEDGVAKAIEKFVLKGEA